MPTAQSEGKPNYQEIYKKMIYTCPINEAITIACRTFRIKRNTVHVGDFSYKQGEKNLLFRNLKAIGFSKANLSRLETWTDANNWH